MHLCTNSASILSASISWNNKDAAEVYKEALSKVYFPNYKNFSDMNKASENFIQKLISIIDELAPFKT